MPIDYAKLNIELTTDPKGLGYSQPPNRNDPADAELLNPRGLGETGIAESVETDLLNREVIVSEFEGLSLPLRQFWQLIVTAGNGVIDPSDTKIKAQIFAIWGLGTTTRANLIALGTREYSRAEKLFGRGLAATHIDVGRARTGDY